MDNFRLHQVPICVLKLQRTLERRHFIDLTIISSSLIISHHLSSSLIISHHLSSSLISFLVSWNLVPFVRFRKLVVLRITRVNQSQPTSQRGSRQQMCFRISLCAGRFVKKEDDHHQKTLMRDTGCGALDLFLHPEHIGNPFAVGNQALRHKMY